MAPLIAPSITRELIAAPSSHWPINRGHEFALKPRRIDAASLVDLRHIRHVRLPPPPPPPCLLHLTVTFDHVSKPCRFNKGTDVGYERRYSRRRSNDGPATVERAYLHFPPLPSPPKRRVFERAIKPPNRSFRPETMRAGSTRSSTWNQEHIPGQYIFLARFLPMFDQINSFNDGKMVTSHETQYR